MFFISQNDDKYEALCLLDPPAWDTNCLEQESRKWIVNAK